MRRLEVAATGFLGANLLHGADHLRQELAGLNVAISVGGAALTAAAIVTFARRRDPAAPLMATVVGLVAAVLVAASHVAPHWGPISASYLDDVDPDALSWVVMLLEVVAAGALAIVGAADLRRRRAPATA